MTDVEGTTYDYDDNGNQVEAGTDTFTWDHENRLVDTDIDSVAGTYAYNGGGLRTSRTIASTTVDYVWDLNASLPVVLEDSDANRYVYGLDLLTRINASDEEWYLADGLGSTTGLADAAGDVTGAYTYDAFGAVRSQSGATTEWSYTGEQVDATGLQYLRARYYDPALGRFLSRDPLTASPGWDGQPYGYANANPVSRSDPTGLEPGDNDATPGPVGISKEERHRRCLEGFIKCEQELVKEAEAFLGPLEPFPGYFGTVCGFVLIRCEQQSSDGQFDFAFARQQMGLPPEDGGSNPLSEFLRWIPKPRLSFGFPDTGSGGYLGRNNKESSFRCVPLPPMLP